MLIDVFFAARDVLCTLLGIPFTPRDRVEASRLSLLAVALCTRHVCGPGVLRCGHGGIAVVCLVRDGELHVRSFIEHHLSLGATRVVLLDNGSTDRTVAIARRFSCVTVLRSRLPFRTYVLAFRSYLLRRYGRRRWCLVADIDERFDYPFSNACPLPRLIAYLDHCGFNAVAACILDMFADAPLNALRTDGGSSLREEYPYCDLANLRERPAVPGKNQFPDTPPPLYCRGVFETVFGTRVPLHKYPLVKTGDGLSARDIGIHRIERGARIADVSAVLFHYPFTQDLPRKCQRAVAGNVYHKRSEKYRAVLGRLEAFPDLNVFREAERPEKIARADDLIGRCVTVSDGYKRHVFD